MGQSSPSGIALEEHKKFDVLRGRIGFLGRAKPERREEREEE